jgi:MFS transporter, DHA1 family, multidrug resistance protein
MVGTSVERPLMRSEKVHRKRYPPAELPTRKALAFLLGALAMLGPSSIDTYLPAFSSIERSLGVTSVEVQQTLSVYMFAFGFMMLWHGALSDAFGRRNIILASLFVFAVASLGCAAAYSVEYLWAFRILQGFSAGAGIVVGRAIVRDIYHGAQATRLLSIVTMIFAIAPAIAPVFGGWLVQIMGWRSIFLFLFAHAAFLLWLCATRLPETLPPEKRNPFNLHVIAASYQAVFTSLLFHLKAWTIAFSFAGLFLYVAAAPTFVMLHLNLGPGGFGWQFIPTVCGIFIGALGANKLAGRVTISQHVGLGFGLLVGAAFANVVYHALLPPAVPWSVLPLLFYAAGMAIIMPVVTLLVIDLFPATRGLAASCQSFTQSMLAAIIAAAVAPVLATDTFLLALGQLTCAIIALSLWLAGRSYHFALERRNLDGWEAVPVE